MAAALREPLRRARWERDRSAWVHFCTGHHVEFLYWEATTVACDRVVLAAGAGEANVVGHWLGRVATLIRGSAAMLHYCAAFDPARYDPCLRASMAAERDAFDPAQYIIATVFRSDQALADYDDYFGVLRSDDMKIGDYWTQAVEKLATVHRSFAMDAPTGTALMRGDGVLLAIISETLAEPPEPSLPTV